MEPLNQILTQVGKISESNFDEVCPVCGDRLYKKIKIVDTERIVKVMCTCRSREYDENKTKEVAQERQSRLEALMRNSLMDAKFRNSTFENWDFSKGTEQMYKLGKRYADNFTECKTEGLGLLIYGPPGNGKTYMSSCIANELLKQFIPVICVSTNGLLSRIQETYNRWGKEAESDVIRGLCNADLLIIDDLGTEKASDWSKKMIYDIIDSRYRSSLPLIITTNLNVNPKETNGVLTDLYDRRTEDRILEMCTPVKNSAPSIRIEEAKKKTDLLREILY